MVEKSQDKEMNKSVAVGNVENNSEKALLRIFSRCKFSLFHHHGGARQNPRSWFFLLNAKVQPKRRKRSGTLFPTTAC